MIDIKAYDQLHEAILLVNAKNEIIYFNYSASVYFQTPPRILKSGITPEEIFVEKTAWPITLLEEARKENEVKISAEISFSLQKIAAQKIFFVLKIVPSSENSQELFLFFRDITVEKHLFEKYKTQMKEIEEGHAQIIQADKLATLGEMTASISHEIANPLTIASGNVEVAKGLLESAADFEGKDVLKNCIENAYDSLQGINEIIINMKTYLHKNEDKKEYVDLKILVEDVLQLLKLSLKENNIELSFDFTDDEVVAFVNPVKIRQVVLNLAKNSFDALCEDRISKKRKLTIHLSKNEDDGSIVLKVIDNGSGIPAHLKSEVFRPFFTTKSIGEGTGLGLPICQKIILAHNGKIGLEDSKDGETCFQVILPGVEVSSYTQNERYLSGLADHPGIKVLALDDEPQVLNVINHILAEEDEFVFIGSTKVEDALRIIHKFGVDVVIADVNMPVRGGFDLALQFENATEAPKFIFMTGGKFSEEDYEKLKFAHVRGLVQKPFKAQELKDIIRKALRAKVV
ncbi:MAG: response regulator [Bdellovibrio sp.]|nr:response regulator [Bdellovibrio sp.]